VKVPILSELPYFYIPAVIKMNTVEVVLFLVSDGYVSIIFATGQVHLTGKTAMDLTRPAVQKYFSNPDQHINFSSGYFFGRQGRFKGGLLPGVEVRI